MSKLITASIICVLLIGSSACADLLNVQSTAIDVGNTVALFGGVQRANASQNLVVGAVQGARDIRGRSAGQGLLVAIGQVGAVSGFNALAGVSHQVGVVGLQVQGIGDAGAPMAQLQSFDVVADQTLGRVGGAGGASGEQIIVLGGAQQSGSRAVLMNQSSGILVTQSGSVIGGPGSAGLVNNTIGVSITQGQIAR